MSKWKDKGIKTPGYRVWECPDCGMKVKNSQEPWYDFCPKCGADNRETTDKCAFCDSTGIDEGLVCVASESKRMGAWLDMLVEVYMEREDDGWYIKGAVAEQKHDNGEIEAKMKILFCPFCGRKL